MLLETMGKAQDENGMLVKLGTPKGKAYEWSNTRKGYWRTSHSPILQRALNNSLLKREGYLPLKELSTQPKVLF